MPEIKIINYRGYQLNVKTPVKRRSDRKHTVKALLSLDEKRTLNQAMLALGYDTVLEFVNMAIANCLSLAITEAEITAAKRKIKERDGIQVNGRLSADVYAEFRRVQAAENLNQRQLVYILVSKAVHMAGFKFN